MVQIGTASSTGVKTLPRNVGKQITEGVTLTMNYSIIRREDMFWSVNMNLRHQTSEYKEVSEVLTKYNLDNRNRNLTRYYDGGSPSDLWAVRSCGIDPATGEEIFLDMNGNKVNEWDAANYKPFGSTDPKIYGTIGTMFTYKKWELNAHLYYKYGGYIYNSTLVDKVENVNPNENGDKRILYDRWNKEGDVAKFKKVSDVSVTNPTSRFIEKENYIQLQSLSIGYDFSCDKLREIGIQRLKLSAIGNDIFTSSTVKMERGTSYPFARTFSLSAQLTF